VSGAPTFDGPDYEVRLERPNGAVVAELYEIGDGDPCDEVGWAPDGSVLAVLTGHVARVRFVDIAWALAHPEVATHNWSWRQVDLSFLQHQKATQKRRPTKFDYLIANNIITEKDLEQAISTSRKIKKPVESILVSELQVTEKTSANPWLPITRPVHCLRRKDGDSRGNPQGIESKLSQEQCVCACVSNGNRVVIAMENPDYLPARDTIRRLIPGKSLNTVSPSKKTFSR